MKKKDDPAFMMRELLRYTILRDVTRGLLQQVGKLNDLIEVGKAKAEGAENREELLLEVAEREKQLEGVTEEFQTYVRELDKIIEKYK